MSEMKLCVNCKHASSEIVTYPHRTLRCRHPKLVKATNYTPVTGEMEAESCCNMRLRGSRCGEDARYFEQNPHTRFEKMMSWFVK